MCGSHPLKGNKPFYEFKFKDCKPSELVQIILLENYSKNPYSFSTRVSTIFELVAFSQC
jgi:hypothetical protein